MLRFGLRTILSSSRILSQTDRVPTPSLKNTRAVQHFFFRSSSTVQHPTAFDVLHQPPKSLSTISQGKDDLALDRKASPGINGVVLRLLGYYSKESIHIRGARRLYEEISSRSDDESFLSKFGLPKNFRTTYSMLVLHVWMILYRLRKEGSDGAAISQTLYDIFMHDCEKRVANEGVKVLISKWLKELEKNFYGACSAYDAAILLPPSSTDLSKSLWRNVFAEDGSEMPSGELAKPVHSLAHYVRREIASLNITDDDSVQSGFVSFSPYT